ncbi:MAG: hypothetical protein ACKOT0_07090 [bacterium]
MRRSLVITAASVLCAVLACAGPATLAQAAAVKVAIRAGDEIKVRTTGAGPKFVLTYAVTDPDREAYIIKTCSYNVAADEYVLCESKALTTQNKGMTRTKTGWRYERFYRYTEAITVKQCAAVNKQRPEFIAKAWIKDRNREVIAEAEHPYVVVCDR